MTDDCIPDRTPESSVEQIMRIQRLRKQRAIGRTQVLEAFAAYLRSTQSYRERSPAITARDWRKL